MEEEQRIKPANILNIVATNQGRREITRERPVAEPLAAERVKALMDEGHYLVDARPSAVFGAGHAQASINVQLESSEFEQRIGWVVPDDSPIILLTDTDDEVREAVYRMAFVGLDQFVEGFLEGGIDAWTEAGLPLASAPQLDVEGLHGRLSENGLRVLDVREKDEWDEGHIEGACFMPYTDMAPQLGTPPRFDELEGMLAKDQEIAVACASAKRSSTAISLMLREGYGKLINVTGGMDAWKRARLPMVDAEGNACEV